VDARPRPAPPSYRPTGIALSDTWRNTKQHLAPLAAICCTAAAEAMGLETITRTTATTIRGKGLTAARAFSKFPRRSCSMRGAGYYDVRLYCLIAMCRERKSSRHVDQRVQTGDMDADCIPLRRVTDASRRFFFLSTCTDVPLDQVRQHLRPAVRRFLRSFFCVFRLSTVSSLAARPDFRPSRKSPDLKQKTRMRRGQPAACPTDIHLVPSAAAAAGLNPTTQIAKTLSGFDRTVRFRRSAYVHRQE